MSLPRFLGEPHYDPVPVRLPGRAGWPLGSRWYRRSFRWRTRALYLVLLVGLLGGYALHGAAATSADLSRVGRVAERSAAPWGAASATRSPAPSVGVVSSPTPTGSLAAPAFRAVGTASWFCLAGRSPCTRGYPGGLYAAAGPALRVGDWRGRQVRVCAGERCVTVELIDFCACPGGRVIDLYADAFARLAPLSRGVVTVSVTW